jgi:serine/threonine-protein kinase
MKVCPQCGSEYELDQRFCPKDGTALRGGAGGDLLGAVIADRYHVLRKLGEGGMGQVYLAEHVKMGRKSAVKVMHAAMNADPDAVARFNREASNAARISHPNVCAIYDFGETPDGTIYLAMEFIEGESLTAVIARAGSLPPARAARITRQVADALSVAHELGIVHRDLKPDNIMVTTGRDGADLVKVVDFGIAKAAQSEAQKVTRTGLVVGTPEYMSPEQLAGEVLDGRSDLYSLALVTFNMLTGHLPFAATSAQEAMIMRLTDQPRPLAAVRPDIAWPAELQRVMDRGLARETEGRYPTALQFARELEAAVARMASADAREAATQVMGAAAPAAATAGTAAIPATRVAAPADRASMATAAVAAPAVPPPARPAPATAARPASDGRRSPVGMVVGAVLGLAVIGSGARYVTRSDTAPVPAAVQGERPTTDPGGPASPAGREASAAPAAGAQPGTDVSAPRVEPASRPPATTPAANAGAAGDADVARAADALVARVEAAAANDDATAAAAARREAEQLLPRATRPADRVRLDYVRAVGSIYADDVAVGCGILRDLRPRAAGTEFDARVTALLAQAGC